MALKFKQGRTQFLIDALQPDRLTRIVDVGANPINDNPYKPLLDMGACEVYGFEPHPEAYAQLLQSKGDREHYYPFAVGDGNSGTLKITSGSGFSSLLEPNENFWTYTGRFLRGMRILDRVPVETKRLDDVEGLPEFDLMKIDIQGGETAVFDNGTRVLSNALAVISEVAAKPLYEDQPLLDDQMASLRKVGFHLHKFLFFKALRYTNPFSRQFSAGLHKNQLSDGDAVFVRGLMDLNSLSDENLKHLSILADSVIMSADLVTVALRELINREVIGDEVAKTYVNKVNRTSKAYERPMIVTTTPSVEGYQIASYKGIVVGEAILGANIIRDVFAGITDILGGRSGAYEQELAKAREVALKEMEDRAAAVGATDVVGVDLDHEVINNMRMVSASGTAVVLG